MSNLVTISPRGLLPPNRMGMPEKFYSYRPHQDSAIVQGLDSKQRVIVQAAPVGFGKSLNAVMQAILTGRRTVILTATKGLQDQYSRDFASVGMVDIRGRDNYACPLDPAKYTCEDGPCLGGLKCPLRRQGKCPYASAYETACAAQLVVTNYAYYMAICAHSPTGLGDIQFLICDEAHEADAQLDNATAVSLSDHEILAYCQTEVPREPIDQTFVDANWSAWAYRAYSTVYMQCVQLTKELTSTAAPSPHDMKRLKRLKSLAGQLLMLSSANMQDSPWCWERVSYGQHHGWSFAPLFVAPYAERYLFRGVKKLLLTSGTISPRTAPLLGIDPATVDYQDYPSPFPAHRGPIYRVPGIRNDKRADDLDKRYQVALMDGIIQQRGDRKGIVQTVSYDRQRMVLEGSRFSQYMLYNQPKRKGQGRRGDDGESVNPMDISSVVQRFRGLPAPLLLVSPTVTTGWDFPYTDAEYQIILKLPFPDMSNKLMRARSQYDKLYAAVHCATQLQQMAGRVMRAPDDQGETFILDNHCGWFCSKHADLFNLAWWQFYQFVKQVPAPPPPLRSTQ